MPTLLPACCLAAEPLRIKALGEGHVLVYQCDPELLPGLVALLEEQEVELVTAHAKACRQYRLEYEEAQVGRWRLLQLEPWPWLPSATTLSPQQHLPVLWVCICSVVSRQVC